MRDLSTVPLFFPLQERVSQVSTNARARCTYTGELLLRGGGGRLFFFKTSSSFANAAAAAAAFLPSGPHMGVIAVYVHPSYNVSLLSAAPRGRCKKVDFSSSIAELLLKSFSSSVNTAGIPLRPSTSSVWRLCSPSGHSTTPSLYIHSVVTASLCEQYKRFPFCLG